MERQAVKRKPAGVVPEIASTSRQSWSGPAHPYMLLLGLRLSNPAEIIKRVGGQEVPRARADLPRDPPRPGQLFQSLAHEPLVGVPDCPDTPSWGTPTANDACDATPTITIESTTPPPTTGCLAYVATRIWRATDDCGNSANTCSQQITVRDNTSPTISCMITP